MGFFNKKEDVIDIKLTPYGKKLFAMGQFDPVYYSFHDEDILYDRTHIGLEENAKYDNTNSLITNKFGNQSIDKRISDSLSFTAQPIRSSFESETVGVNKNLKENIFDLFSFIGSSKFESQYYPAYEVKLYRGNMTGSITYTTGSGFSNRHSSIYIEVTDVYNNVSKSVTSDEYFLIRIRELNSLFEKENFEIEFFEIDEYDAEYKTQLKYLSQEFTKSEEEGLIGFSDLPTNGQISEGLPKTEDETVDYFFNVLFDKEILNDLIYESNPTLPEVIEIQQGIRSC